MIGRTRWRFREVTSTQDIAWQLAVSGAPHGTVIRADFQSAGRGRLGRRWDVPANTALTFSIVLRPGSGERNLGPLSVQLAGVLCHAFARAGARDVALKWPNDVLIGGLKVSGILVQTRTMPDLVVVAGIGINISPPGEALPPTATSLSAATGKEIDAEVHLDDVLAGIGHLWTGREAALSTSEVSEIDRLLWLRDEPVTLLDAERVITGTIAGVAPDGGLRLIDQGIERVIHAGEIVRGPRPIEVAQQP